MNSVFILWHCHEVGETTDEKLVGVYKTRSDAELAINRLKDKPGFVDNLDGFEIHEYVIGRDGWTEGYIPETDAA